MGNLPQKRDAEEAKNSSLKFKYRVLVVDRKYHQIND